MVESYREETDTPVGATPRSAADAPASALLRPFHGDVGVDRVYGNIDTFSDVFHRLDKALRDAFPELHSSELRKATPSLRGDAGRSGGPDQPRAAMFGGTPFPRRGGTAV